MHAFLEMWADDGFELRRLEADRITVGRSAENDIALADDQLVSSLHAVMTRYASGWAVRDLNSTNGTKVNGRRLWSEHPLRSGDEIGIGGTRFVYRDNRSPVSTTHSAQPPPELTTREREILVTLCRPILAGGTFTAPASVRRIAEASFVSSSAVKQQLANLYRKFEVPEGGDRRVELANRAIQSGAIGLADLHATD